MDGSIAGFLRKGRIMATAWKWKFYGELTPDELYDILALRQEVFMLEQNSLYLDADGADKDAWHLQGRNRAGRLVACLRVLPASAPGEQTVVGRFAVTGDVRGNGIGRRGMQECIRWVDDYFPEAPIRIGAQCYLEDFYRRFGFSPIGAPYDDAGVMHVDMRRRPADEATPS